MQLGNDRSAQASSSSIVENISKINFYPSQLADSNESISGCQPLQIK
jgi:hypothetical protein